MKQQMRVLVLGPEGSGRAALSETLVRLGYVVLAAEARTDVRPPSCGDIVMLDLRDDDTELHGLTEGLMGDDRPLMIVSERPRRLMRALSGRPAGTMVMTGAESDDGYRVALKVCGALRSSALERAGARLNGGAARVAAL